MIFPLSSLILGANAGFELFFKSEGAPDRAGHPPFQPVHRSVPASPWNEEMSFG